MRHFQAPSGRTEAALKEQGMPKPSGCVMICPFSFSPLVSRCLVTTNLMFSALSLRVKLDPTERRFGRFSF